MFSGYAEAGKLDSLLIELSKIQEDTSLKALDQKSILCNDIAICYQGIAENQKARSYFLQSIYFTETRINRENNWDAQNNYDMGYLYKNLAIFESTQGSEKQSEQYMGIAEKYYMTLRPLLPEEEYNWIMIEFYQTNFARAYHTMHFDIAEKNILKAEKLIIGIGEIPVSLAKAYRYHGEMYSAMEDYDEAEKYFVEALNIVDQLDSIEAGLEVTIVHSVLSVKYHLGEYEDLIGFIERREGYRTIEEGRSYVSKIGSGNTQGFLNNLFILSYAHLQRYHQTQKMTHLERAYELQLLGFELAETRTVANQAEKIGSSLSNPGNKVMALLMCTIEAQEAGEVDSSSIYRAMRIVDVYHSSRLHLERIAYDINAKYSETHKALKNKEDYLNRKLAEHTESGGSEEERDSLRAAAYQLSLALLQADRETKKESIMEEYRLGQDGFEMKMRAYLHATRKNVLTYFYDDGGDSLYVLLANADTSFIRATVVDEKLPVEIEELYNLNAHLQYQNEQIQRQEELNRLFYERLFEPVEHYLNSTEILVYPLNEISYISFDALMDRDGKYLVDQYAFQYTTSLFSILNPAITHESTNTAASFYPSDYGTSELAWLFNGKEEVEQISTLLGGRNYTGAEASKQNFLREARSCQILHLTSHSMLNMDHPYESYMIFDATNDSANHLLYAYEIFAATLNAELVILSSCNSAQGTIEEGIGTVSLANAFYFAGVPSTISSLWSAQDKSSSEIMTSFYKFLSSGIGKSESLRRAKNDYLKSADKIKCQPFFWANYVVYGDDTALFEKGKRQSLWNYAIGLGLVCLLALVGRRYFKTRKAVP